MGYQSDISESYTKIMSSYYSIAIGYNPGIASFYSITMGYNAGGTDISNRSIAIGYGAGSTYIHESAIAIGDEAGKEMGKNSIAIGRFAGKTNMGDNSIALGLYAGVNNMGDNSIAIGRYTARNNLGENSIVIGNDVECSYNNTIVLNATSLPESSIAYTISVDNSNAFYVKPIRLGSTNNFLTYNSVTGEILYDNSLNITVGTIYAGGSDFKVEGIKSRANEGNYRVPTYLWYDTTTSIIKYFQLTSDDRLKHNEVHITNGLSVIRKLSPQKYHKTSEIYDANYVGDISIPYIIETGLIAQEVYEIEDLSYLVYKFDYVDRHGNTIPDVYSLRYNEVFVYNIAATKELDAKVTELEIKNLALETQVSSLTSLVATMQSQMTTMQSQMTTMQSQMTTMQT